MCALQMHISTDMHWSVLVPQLSSMHGTCTCMNITEIVMKLCLSLLCCIAMATMLLYVFLCIRELVVSCS